MPRYLCKPIRVIIGIMLEVWRQYLEHLQLGLFFPAALMGFNFHLSCLCLVSLLEYDVKIPRLLKSSFCMIARKCILMERMRKVFIFLEQYLAIILSFLDLLLGWSSLLALELVL